MTTHLTKTGAPLFRLSVGYRSYLMSAQDAATVMEMLGRAKCVSREWTGDYAALVEADPDSLTLEQARDPVISRAEYDARCEAYRAERDAERAAERAADA